MQSRRGALLPFAVGAFLALPALHGCTQIQSHDSLVSLIKDRTAPSPAAQPTKPEQEPHTVPREIDHTTLPQQEPEPRTVPRELSHVTLPPHIINAPDVLQTEAIVKNLQTLPSYTIEAPDVLQIEAVVKNPQTGQNEPLPTQPIAGTFVVRTDGAVNLGTWGSVSVAGRTLENAAQRIREHLTKARGADANAGELRVTVDVHAYNSKRYYIIINGNDVNEQITSYPLTDSRTVTDAIASVGGLEEIANKGTVQMARKQANGTFKAFPVDWRDITQNGVTTTNYQLQAGDRIYVTNEK